MRPTDTLFVFIWFFVSTNAYDLTFSDVTSYSRPLRSGHSTHSAHHTIANAHSHGIGDAVNVITFSRFIINRITCLKAPTWQTVAMAVKPAFGNYFYHFIVSWTDGFILCRCLIHFCIISVWFIHVNVPDALIFCADIDIAIMKLRRSLVPWIALVYWHEMPWGCRMLNGKRDLLYDIYTSYVGAEYFWQTIIRIYNYWCLGAEWWRNQIHFCFQYVMAHVFV